MEKIMGKNEKKEEIDESEKSEKREKLNKFGNKMELFEENEKMKMFEQTEKFAKLDKLFVNPESFKKSQNFEKHNDFDFFEEQEKISKHEKKFENTEKSSHFAKKMKLEETNNENFDKPLIPLMKSNKNIFNTPTCLKNSKNEGSSSHKKPLIWDENQPKASIMESNFFSNEKKKSEFFNKNPESIKKNSPEPIFSSNEKKKSGFYNKKLEISNKSPENYGFIKENSRLFEEKENDYYKVKMPIGVVVADRISLIERRKTNEKKEKNSSFISDFTIDSNTISKDFVHKNPYFPTKGNMVSPLQKI